ncbi:unnamed protein product [Owenia fusiformis]|uniref:Uncharacterized protein n=1 Tax=Owenia fusiformis TaxID=6347 RepID=A0A8J1UJK0_OWEFU|nr:unnamed protein product [Owenia fusiformis]
MAVLAILFTEKGRQTLGQVAAGFHALLAVFGVAVVLMGVYLGSKIEVRINILVDYDHYNLLPHMLISVGSILIFLHIIGAKICYDCGFYDTRSRFESVMVLYMVIMLTFQIIIISAGSMCFSHTHMLRHSFNHGIMKSSKNYKNSLQVKRTIDTLNLEYKCCGVGNYTDWFKISWINNEFLDLDSTRVLEKMKNNQYYTDDVPFSCCDPSSPRACIHHGVHSFNRHPNYNQTEVTLYKKGCSIQIMLFFERILSGFGGGLFSSLIAEWIVLILMRYLQSSILMAREWGEAKCRSPGYLCAQCPCGCCDGGHTDLEKPENVEVESPYDQKIDREAEIGNSDDEDGEFDDFGYDNDEDYDGYENPMQREYPRGPSQDQQDHQPQQQADAYPGDTGDTDGGMFGGMEDMGGWGAGGGGGGRGADPKPDQGGGGGGGGAEGNDPQTSGQSKDQKQADKQSKKDQKQADKHAKKDQKQADKQAKKEQKQTSKQDKKEQKQTEKQAKKDKKQTDKNAKKDKTQTDKQAKKGKKQTDNKAKKGKKSGDAKAKKEKKGKKKGGKTDKKSKKGAKKSKPKKAKKPQKSKKAKKPKKPKKAKKKKAKKRRKRK